jgi:glutamine amidotransferase
MPDGTMKPRIAVIDYEMGNLHSVAKAIERAGASVTVTDSPSVIHRADGVVLPGVGAFGEAAKRLRLKKLMTPIREALVKQKPFLGICLGLQLLFERSEESPGAKGLGYLKGSVVRFRMPKRSSLKVPHMGWNTVKRGPAALSPVLKDIKTGNYFYFVHSFFPVPLDRAVIATETEYGRPFCSAIAKGRLFASQYHPEKSGERGQRILRNFVKAVAACS